MIAKNESLSSEELPGLKVGLVLCGGGSRGALEVGFYRALVEMGVKIDLITGASVGALNGAFIAAGVSARRMEELWRSLRYRDVFGLNWRSLLSLRNADSIYGHHRLRQFLERHLPARQFADLSIPLTVLATDLDTGESVWLEQGGLIEAILASVAIPGLLPPVRHRHRQLVDGGIVNNLPLDVAVEKGATTLLAIRCRCEQTQRRPVRGIINILSRFFELAEEARNQRDMSNFSRPAEMILVQPCFDFEVGLLDFSHSAQLMSMAYEATLQQRELFQPLIARQRRASEFGKRKDSNAEQKKLALS